MAEGKWIDTIGPNTPLAEATRQVLAVRLEAVLKAMGPASTEADRNPEAIHQLRVATRRASAALRVFGSSPGMEKAKKVRKAVRALRRGAGAARDLDVFQVHLLEWTARPPGSRRQPAVDFLLGHLLALQGSARTTLRAQVEREAKRLPAAVRQLLDGLGEEKNRKTRTLAHRALPCLLPLFQELEKTLRSEDEDPTHLHALRILGKRLRYTMEIFVHCFAAPFRDHFYPAVEQMQEILGQVHDRAVGAARLTGLLDLAKSNYPRQARGWKKGLTAFAAYEKKGIRNPLQEFRLWRAHWLQLDAAASVQELLLPA